MGARSDGTQRAKALSAVERRAQIFEYVKAGSSYRDIGRKFGVSHVTIARDVRRTLQALHRTAIHDLDLYRQIELVRLDQLLQGIWLDAVAGNPGAVTLALRILERRARLLGLDAPTKIDIEARVRAIASQEGLDADEVMHEVERLLAAPNA
jgi:uncharacterized protein YerC